MDYEEIFKQEIEKRVKDGYPAQKAIISYFLNLYFRLDYGDERDLICDGERDKGIDAIFVDDDSKEIYFIQSKFSFKGNHALKNIGFDANKHIGDTEPKEFIGSIEQFTTKEQIEAIINEPTTNRDLVRLITEQNISDKIESYTKLPIYVTTRYIGTDTKSYIDTKPNLTFFTPNDFEDEHNKYTGLLSDSNININLEFEPIGNIINAPHDSIICIMKVKDLISIDGINDYTIFHKNVRGWLGKRTVYKSIKKDLNKQSFNQSNNILMHNGITILAKDVEYKVDENKVIAKSISIVNGCQSTYAYYDNKDKIQDTNSVLVKIIKQEEHEEQLGKEIVYNSNNQASVKMSDLVSLTHNAQVIQKLFETNHSEWCILNKAGRTNFDCDNKKPIQLSTLAQIVASFYNVGYIQASDKNKLLETSFSEVFTRHLEYSHYKIVLHLMDNIDKKLADIKESGTDNQKTLLHTYYLTKLFILYIFKRIYTDIYSLSIYAISSYEEAILSEEYTKKILFHISSFIIEIDSYLEENSHIANYKSLLKRNDESEKMVKNILKAYQKDVAKDSQYSLNFS